MLRSGSSSFDLSRWCFRLLGALAAAAFSGGASAGPATHFQVNAPATWQAGTTSSINMKALDASNAQDTNYSGTVHLTSTDPHAVLPPDFALSHGLGGASLTLKTGGDQTVTVTDTTNESITGTSNTIAVSGGYGVITHFSVTVPSTATVGTGFTISVTALDQYNSTVTTYSGTVHFTSSDGSAALPANSPLTNGAGSFPVTFNVSGYQTVTATDTAKPSLHGTSTNVFVYAPLTITVNDAGDSGPGNCNTTCTLRDALAEAGPGDLIAFSPTILPATITLLHGELPLLAPVTIEGPGAARLAIDANQLSRVLHVNTGSIPLGTYVSGLTIKDGTVVGVPGGPVAPLSGATGKSGLAAQGGCILMESSTQATVLDEVDIRDCTVTGGAGGDGGSGADGGFGQGGDGGSGGGGGDGLGGAIFDKGMLLLTNSSVTGVQAFGGTGGGGGDGGGSNFAASDGNGGVGGVGGQAGGGAIYVGGAGASALIENSTLGIANAYGGHGGQGGNTATGITGGSPTPTGGSGGAGGDSYGGLLQVLSGAGEVELRFATLANGFVYIGFGGTPGDGSPGGITGPNGTSLGNAVYAENAVTAASTIIVGGIHLCYPTASLVVPSGEANLDEDSSCGFTAHGTISQLFRPFDENKTLPAYVPAYGSAAIDAAATCTDLFGDPLTRDEHATARPQGGKCDLGAIESDYIFVGTFQ